MMRKVMRCSSCGKTTMCVSYDNMTFYCNRCLGYVRRQQNFQQTTTQPKKQEPQPKQTEIKQTKKSKTSKGKSKANE